MNRFFLNRTNIFLGLLSLIIAGMILVFFVLNPNNYFTKKIIQTASICIKNNCFSVELARSAAEKEKGLMHRKELEKGSGMLFIFDREGIYPFWMKNTLIPLDIVWIGSDNKIVFISQNVQPCLPAKGDKFLACPTVMPPVRAKYVLELNAGMCEKDGYKIGDEAIINIK